MNGRLPLPLSTTGQGCAGGRWVNMQRIPTGFSMEYVDAIIPLQISLHYFKNNLK